MQDFFCKFIITWPSSQQPLLLFYYDEDSYCCVAINGC